MRFEWDLRKSQANHAKHRVSFDLAELIFYDPFCVVFPNRIVEGEERWHAIGTVPAGRTLYVVHTIREEDGDAVIRIISARKATSHERRRYEEATRASDR